jgi:hypothetical protein
MPTANPCCFSIAVSVVSVGPANQAGAQLRWLQVTSTAAPVTLTVRDRDRVPGLYVVRPGMPVAIARPQAGPVTLEWMDAAGKPASQKVVVVKPLTRVTLP